MPASKAAWHKHRDDKNSTPENWKALAMSQQFMKYEATYIQNRFLIGAFFDSFGIRDDNFYLF